MQSPKTQKAHNMRPNRKTLLPQYCQDQAENEHAGSAKMFVHLLRLREAYYGAGLPVLSFSSKDRTNHEKDMQCLGKTSRTVIRAAWLRLLPGVHVRSIDQLFSLGP
jgi:hypothetical protein